MRFRILVTTSVLVLSGCTSTVQPPANGPVPLAYGSVDDFTALVPSSDGSPRCQVLDDTPVELGGRAVALVYPRPAEQQVTVYLDPTGEPTRYIDARGDLSLAGDRAGDRTTIGLYLDQGYAVLSNRPASGRHVIVEIPLAEALTPDRLDNPGVALRRVLELCGGAA